VGSDLSDILSVAATVKAFEQAFEFRSGAPEAFHGLQPPSSDFSAALQAALLRHRAQTSLPEATASYATGVPAQANGAALPAAETSVNPVSSARLAASARAQTRRARMRIVHEHVNICQVAAVVVDATVTRLASALSATMSSAGLDPTADWQVTTGAISAETSFAVAWREHTMPDRVVPGHGLDSVSSSGSSAGQLPERVLPGFSVPSLTPSDGSSVISAAPDLAAPGIVAQGPSAGQTVQISAAARVVDLDTLIGGVERERSGS